MNDTMQIAAFFRAGGIPVAILILSMTWMLAQLIGRTAAKFGQRFTERRLMLQQTSTVLRFAVTMAGISGAVASVFQLSDQMLLALGGTLAVAGGIAMKDLAASILAGLIILFDRPFQVGDRVSFGGYYGEIVRIGLRSVRLVTLDDNMVTIPNNKFLTDIVSSGNLGALDMLVQMDFYIGIDQNIGDARKVVREAITSSRYAFLDKPWNVGISQVMHERYLAIRIRAKIYVLDVKHEKTMETEVTERVIEGFRAAQVAPPAILHRALPALGGPTP